MGKKGSWFSAIKKVFLPHSKDKLATDEPNRKSRNEKKKKEVAKLGHATDTNSFLPLFRKPSSIEKILDEAEREHRLVFRPPEQSQTPSVAPQRITSPLVTSQTITSPKAVSPRLSSPLAYQRLVSSPKLTSPKATSNIHKERYYYRPEPTLRSHNAAATKIQAAYRSFVARRSFKALKGLVRLQGVIRGQNVKRQVTNAMKYMQLLVRVQTQIQSRRIQLLENQARQQAQLKNNKEIESNFGKAGSQMIQNEAGNLEDWDDSLLTKEEIEERLQRKVDAVVKRERAMAYAYSHQLWKCTPKSAQSSLMDIRSTVFPSWWNWVERQQAPPRNSLENPAVKNFQVVPRPDSELKSNSPAGQSSTNANIIDNYMAKSSKSTTPILTRQARTPNKSTPAGNSTSLSKHSKAIRAYNNGSESPFDFPLKDDDSLMSCPPFSVPNYMVPTASAQAKIRANSNNLKERFSVNPAAGKEKRVLSFPLAQGIGSFKWNKAGSLFGGKDSTSQRVLNKNQSLQSMGNLSVDSTVSMPATVGRKPAFNRFV